MAFLTREKLRTVNFLTLACQLFGKLTKETLAFRSISGMTRWNSTFQHSVDYLPYEFAFDIRAAH